MIKDIINQLRNGGKLIPMQNAGSFFEDGFYILKENNGMVGITEVMTAEILSLEKKGLIFFNANLGRHVLTKKGEKE